MGKVPVSWKVSVKCGDWGQNIPYRGNSKCKGPGLGMKLACCRNSVSARVVVEEREE